MVGGGGAIAQHPADTLGRLLAEDTAPIVLDGGLATQLEAQGADLSDALWSARLLLEDPEEIVRAHLAFFRAGAQVAITASYQATFQGFAARGIDRDDAEALLRLSVRLADDARRRWLEERGEAGPPLFVAASVGPYGAMLADGSEFRGRYGLTVEELVDFHRERMAVLADAGPDLLACETIPELEEAVAIGRLLDEIGTTAWLSFSCRDGGHLRSGVPIEEAIAVADAADGVVAVGVNCTAPEHVDELLARARPGTRKPLVVYPNSGERWNADDRAWTIAPAEADVERTAVDRISARRWSDEGARLIGGCCRVSPAAIAAMAAELHATPTGR